jgi:hypothetical protein
MIGRRPSAKIPHSTVCSTARRSDQTDRGSIFPYLDIKPVFHAYPLKQFVLLETISFLPIQRAQRQELHDGQVGQARLSRERYQ